MRLTLEELEADRGDVEPFQISLDDDTLIDLPHPKDLPFSSLVNFDANQPALVLRALMGNEAFDVFAGNPRVTLGILEKVLTAYYTHYGLGGPGEASASQPSSIGSAGRSKRTSGSRKTAAAS